MMSHGVPNTLWRNVAPLLLPYEGQASQIYVLDLPLHVLTRTIYLFRKSVENCRIRTLADISYKKGEALSCDDTNISRVVTGAENNERSVIDGRLPPARSLSLVVWPNASRSCFDVELFFWADEFFDNSINEDHRMKLFGDVLFIAEAFRAATPKSMCVLTQSEAGDPRDDIGRDWAFFW